MLCMRGTSHGPVSLRHNRSSTETAEQIELVFGLWASFHPSYIGLLTINLNLIVNFWKIND